MFEGIKNWLRGVSMRVLGISSIERAMGVQTALSAPMDAAIRLWLALYGGNPPWGKPDVASMNLPAFVAAEVARITTVEMQSVVSGSARADYLNAQYQPVVDDARLFMEYAAASGTVLLKPYIDSESIRVDYVMPNMFKPTRFSSSGEILGCVFATEMYRNAKRYTRLEAHELQGETYTITSKAYVSEYHGNEDLGREIPLTEVAEWADIDPDVKFLGVKRPLFAVLKMPGANAIDPSSAMGVSAYARAIELIREADCQFGRLIWELESGERALFVDEAAFDRDASGRPMLPNKRLYRTLRSGESDLLYEEWSPTLRQKDQVEALDSLLQRVEDACGLSRGTLSRAPESAAGGARTATELRIMRQRTYALVIDTQKALQNALTDLLEAMDAWATIGNLAEPGGYDTTFDFSDSVISDRQADFQERLQLVAAGALQLWELRAWYTGEEEAAAKKALAGRAELFELPFGRAE